MNGIFLVNEIAEPLAEIILQAVFAGKLANRKIGFLRILLFSFLTAAVIFVPISSVLRRAVLPILMVIFFEAPLKIKRGGVLLLYAFISGGTMSLCFGISDSVFSAVIACAGGADTAAGCCAVMILSELFSLALYCFVCGIICRKKNDIEQIDPRRTVTFVIPLLLILSICEYIRLRLYSAVDTGVSAAEHFCAAAFMLIVFFGFICLLCAFDRELAQSKRLELVKLRGDLRERYAAEAKMLYNETKSFRHDIKNHLSVLCGLMEKRDYAAASSYLYEINERSNKLSFAFNTGVPELDILFENKLSDLPEDVSVKCNVTIPKNCSISEYDLCTIFANALDNAVKACGRCELHGKKFIEINSAVQGNFLFVNIENSFDEKPFRIGTGLQNIKRTAEKYGGTVKLDSHNNVFSLRIIFNISQQ